MVYGTASGCNDCRWVEGKGCAGEGGVCSLKPTSAYIFAMHRCIVVVFLFVAVITVFVAVVIVFFFCFYCSCLLLKRIPSIKARSFL